MDFGPSRRVAAGYFPRKEVLVPVLLGAVLGSHTGMPQDNSGVVGDGEAQGVDGARPLPDLELPARVVGDPRRVGAPVLALPGQSCYDAAPLPAAETTAV